MFVVFIVPLSSLLNILYRRNLFGASIVLLIFHIRLLHDIGLTSSLAQFFEANGNGHITAKKYTSPIWTIIYVSLHVIFYSVAAVTEAKTLLFICRNDKFRVDRLITIRLVRFFFWQPTHLERIIKGRTRNTRFYPNLQTDCLDRNTVICFRIM